MTASLDELPSVAAHAWVRFHDEVRRLVGDDPTALWGYSGTVFPERPRRLGDLDTFAVFEHVPDEDTKGALERAEEEIARAHGIEWDTWYVLAADAVRSEPPRHALDPARRHTSWAIDRAQWHGGPLRRSGRANARRAGPPTDVAGDRGRSEPGARAPRATRPRGDDDAFEATYAIWNGSRILYAVETGDVAVSKRSAGMWAIERLPERWHEAIFAADRAYDGEATSRDEAVLREAMAPFVAMVREHPSLVEPRPEGELPRWGDY